MRVEPVYHILPTIDMGHCLSIECIEDDNRTDYRPLYLFGAAIAIAAFVFVYKYSGDVMPALPLIDELYKVKPTRCRWSGLVNV